MTRTLSAMLKGVFCVGALSACVATVSPYGDVEVSSFPPPEFIATASPVYFEGHAAYFWGGHWYYRSGPGWHMYRQEPPVLHDHRVAHGAPPRQFYGRAHGGGFHKG